MARCSCRNDALPNTIRLHRSKSSSASRSAFEVARVARGRRVRGGATTTLRRCRRRARRSRRRPGLRRIFVEPSPAAAVRDHPTRHSRELSAASELECSSLSIDP